MDTAFWLNRWREQRIGFHQQEINPYLQSHLPGLQLTVGSSVFVPLCGKSRDMLWLRDQGYAVVAVEVSELAIAAFFRENGLRPQCERREKFVAWRAPGITIFEGDYFDLSTDDLGNVQAVYDRAALIALSSADRKAYAQHMLTLLPKEAHILLVTLEYDQDTMAGPPFSVSALEVQTLFGERFEVHLLECEPQAPGPGRATAAAVAENVYLLVPKVNGA